ncbi:MAG: DUF4013 domain-containing protein [Candidatus Nanoarchaeia archaeon]|nr:DUF4013 domain-containing protein [Candidatus Nanoarchaeia archaeon]MDD5239139.1 DUF4013 domain-containing protein [Candidatus Nanoarchaeia archaeon]
MVDVLDSLRFPFEKKNIISFLILSVLNVIWYLLVPLVAVNGYVVMLIRNVIEKKQMPDWTKFKFADWLYLLKHGFLYSVIMAVYFAVPFLLAFLGTNNTISFGLILASFITFLFVMAVLPMALVYYAATESFIQAFNLPEIMLTIFRNIWKYLLVYFTSLALFVIALFIGQYLFYFAGIVFIFPTVFAAHAFAKILAETQ